VSRRSSNEVCRHEKSNKNRKKREMNTSRVCLKEVQETIAFACVDSQSLIQRRASLSEAAIERCHSPMYNGDDKNGALSPTLNTVQMLDLNKFKILYTLVRVLQQARLILSKHTFVSLVSSTFN
jgi:hypothetical protein